MNLIMQEKFMKFSGNTISIEVKSSNHHPNFLSYNKRLEPESEQHRYSTIPPIELQSQPHISLQLNISDAPHQNQIIPVEKASTIGKIFGKTKSAISLISFLRCLEILKDWISEVLKH
ncbi:all1480 [Nostoc sp. PCC 7120 = FACHB-418]|nr:all1480 [Nostoc sp. PCC 7120 = FACHB-418]